MKVGPKSSLRPFLHRALQFSKLTVFPTLCDYVIFSQIMRSDVARGQLCEITRVHNIRGHVIIVLYQALDKNIFNFFLPTQVFKHFEGKKPPLPLRTSSLIFMASLPRYQKTYLLCIISLEYSATVKNTQNLPVF